MPSTSRARECGLRSWRRRLGASSLLSPSPHAYDTQGAWFAVPYLAVRLLHIGLYVRGLRHDPAQQAAIKQLAPWFLVAPCVALAGGLVSSTDLRTALWAVSLAIDVAGALGVGRAGFRVSSSHFAERYALFVIIALGESIVAIGVGAAARPARPDLRRCGRDRVRRCGGAVVGVLRLRRDCRGPRVALCGARAARTTGTGRVHVLPLSAGAGDHLLRRRSERDARSAASAPTSVGPRSTRAGWLAAPARDRSRPLPRGQAHRLGARDRDRGNRRRGQLVPAGRRRVGSPAVVAVLVVTVAAEMLRLRDARTQIRADGPPS